MTKTVEMHVKSQSYVLLQTGECPICGAELYCLPDVGMLFTFQGGEDDPDHPELVTCECGARVTLKNRFDD